MLPGFRMLKRLMIAILFIAFFGAIIFFTARAIHEPLPTPTPDPTSELKPLEVLETHLLKITEGDYDVVAKVRNPNSNFGSGDVRYKLDLFSDGTGGAETKISFEGSFYILPGQTKYIVHVPISSTLYPATRAHVTIVSIDWRELDPLATQGVYFVVTGDEYRPGTNPNIFSKLAGIVVNNSDFDIGQIDVVAVLMDASGIPIAINRSEIRTFLAHTTRGFEMAWFKPFVGDVTTRILEVNANLFENNTFIRAYGGQEQFQSY